MIKKSKLYNRPREPFNLERMRGEDLIVHKYGLKNKKEIWKAKAKIDLIRNRAKKLINSEPKKQEEFLNKLKAAGYKAETTPGVLELTEEDILNRRLQTIVFKKGLSTTSKGARQLITHKKILVNEQIVNIPSYSVPFELEDKIKLSSKIKNKKPEEIAGEYKE
ncbi:MAG: 30S ribosomal protein S4 [Candidatus Pacearchaeota archaeon]